MTSLKEKKPWFKNLYVLRRKQFTLIRLDQHIFVQIKTWFIIHYTCKAIPQKNEMIMIQKDYTLGSPWSNKTINDVTNSTTSVCHRF